MKPIKSMKAGDVDTKQPILILPIEFVGQFPKNFVAEYTELSATVLELKMVDPKSPAGNRRFKAISHHGSTQVSIPRPWLRDKVARPIDDIDVYHDPSNPHVLRLALRRLNPTGVV